MMLNDLTDQQRNILGAIFFIALMLVTGLIEGWA